MQTLVESRDERRLTALQQRYQKVALLIVDELGVLPFKRAPAVSCCSTFWRSAMNALACDTLSERRGAS